MANGYTPLQIPQCIPAPLRRTLQEADRQLQLAFDTIEENNTNVMGPPGPNYFASQLPSYYLNSQNHTGFPQNDNFQVRRIELTGAVSGSPGSANAKFSEWTGSAYAVTGSVFTVYDPYDSWGHAASGDWGFAAYDETRGVYLINWMASPMVRSVTLGAALKRTGDTGYATVTGTDETSGSVTVEGRFVRSGRQLPNGARCVAAWFVKQKKWYVVSCDQCDEDNPSM